MILTVEDVWKRYRAYGGRDRLLRAVFAGRVPVPGRGSGWHWALQDVSLEMAPGESVGVVGGNGAGKSTLLRLVAGVGTPTRGQVRAPEQTAAVLTLGDVFDLDLTGRENAITAAIVAGFGRREARARLADIVAFAELEHAVDAPVRTYSEGMKLRLAFGVIAQLRPEALVVDEALTVGDARFQERCLQRVAEIRADGAGLLLASHDLDLVARTCERAMWIDGGRVRATGTTQAVLAQYRDAMLSATVDRTPAPQPGDPEDRELGHSRFGSQDVVIEDVRASGQRIDDRSTELPCGAPLSVAFTISSRRGPVPVHLSVAVYRERDGLKCCDAVTSLGSQSLATGVARVELSFARLELAADDYRVEVGVWEHGWSHAYDLHVEAQRLRLYGKPSQGVHVPDHAWRIG